MESLTQLPSTLLFCYLWNTALICMMVTALSVFRPEKRKRGKTLTLQARTYLPFTSYWPELCLMAIPQCKGVWEMWFLARVAASQVNILQLQRKGYQETAYLPWVTGGNTVTCVVSTVSALLCNCPRGGKANGNWEVLCQVFAEQGTARILMNKAVKVYS